MEINVSRVNNGIYDVHVISDDEYIGPMIARGHEWDRWMRRDVRRWHVPGTEILDIGANIGYNTMMFSDYGPVVSFEPMFHKIVELNVKSNALRYDVQIIPCALSDEKMVSKIYVPSRGCESNTLVNYGGTSFNLEDDMRGESVDAYCERLDDIYTGIPSFIKIDVEGHELKVLKGAEQTLRKHKPTVLIEIHDFSEDNVVHKFMLSLGYDAPETRPDKVYMYIGQTASSPSCNTSDTPPPH